MSKEHPNKNVIGKNQIEQYLLYVIEKYGKDFVNLYEKKRILKTNNGEL